MKSSELVQAVDGSCASRSSAKLFASSSGFSLVEVMLSIGIVAFAVVGVLTAFPVGIEAARDSRDETTAALIADNVLTKLRSQNFGGSSSAGGSVFIMPEAPPRRINDGLKRDYGWTAVANMYYYARDGRPANADSSADGRAPTGSYKGDEGYFGVRIYVNNDPHFYNDQDPHKNCYLKIRDDKSVIYLTDLACVIVEVSWPARMPYDNRKFKRNFDTCIANLH